MYFQVCSNSTYLQHSGERYRTNGPLVLKSNYFQLSNLWHQEVNTFGLNSYSSVIIPEESKFMNH